MFGGDHKRLDFFPQVYIVSCECLRVSPSCSIVRVRRAQVMATSDSNLLVRSRACGVVFQNRGSRPGQEGFQGDLNAIVIAAVRAAISCFVLSLKDCSDALRVTLRTCVCLCGAKHCRQSALFRVLLALFCSWAFCVQCMQGIGVFQALLLAHANFKSRFTCARASSFRCYCFAFRVIYIAVQIES